MTEENNFVNNLNDIRSKSEKLNDNISYSYINTNEIKTNNLNTTNNITNISKINPFSINLKPKKLSYNKSNSNNKNIVKSNSNNKLRDQIEQKIINNINLEFKIKDLIKENKELQNEVKYEKQQRKKDQKNIELLKRTINNLISENNKDIIAKVPKKNNQNKKTYADLLLSMEKVIDENNILKEKNSKLSNEKNELINIKSKIISKEKQLNYYISKNEELSNKCEILEKQNLRLNENLKNFKNFEEMKISNELLEKNLNSQNEENIKLKNEIKEKTKEINELKLMKYDDKLFNLENDLNKYKLKDQQNENNLNKLTNELNDIKKKLNLTSLLLEERQNTIKENRSDIENNTIKYNDLKTNYDSLTTMKEKIILENNDLKLKNSQINYELNQFKNNYMKYKDELKHASMQLICLKNEKNKNEAYFLNQISIIQKEKNIIENQLNKIREKGNENNNLNIYVENNNLENNHNGEFVSKEKYSLALQEIKGYNNDNKKLFDLSIKLKNELNSISEEKNFYSKLINKIIDGNYIDNEFVQFKDLIKKNIENFLDIQHLNQLKYDLNSKLKNYGNIIKNINKKPDSTGTGKSYEINKNFYDDDDFSEIAKIQNHLLIINDKLNHLDENKSKILREMEKY